MPLELCIVLIFALCSVQEVVGVRSKFQGPDDMYTEIRDKIWEFLRTNPCDGKAPTAATANRLCDAAVRAFRTLPQEEQGQCLYSNEGQCDWNNRVCDIIFPGMAGEVHYDKNTSETHELKSGYHYKPFSSCVKSIKGYEQAIKIVKGEKVKSSKVVIGKHKGSSSGSSGTKG